MAAAHTRVHARPVDGRAVSREDGWVTRLHLDELTVDIGLVRRLVDRTFPELAHLSLHPLGTSGSSNVLFRLGADLLVRLPRQPGGGKTIEKEARWLPHVQAHVSTDVPEVVGVGTPDLGYDETWSITRWLEGSVATTPLPSSPEGSTGLAGDLAQFVAELRAMDVTREATDDDALEWYRGLSLSSLDAPFRDWANRCRTLDLPIDMDDVLRVWDRAVESDEHVAHPAGWYHGDLLAENLLLDADGGLAAVLDFGGLGIGTPTVDLVVAWEALDEAGRHEFRRALDVDDLTWTASRGWALFLAVMTFPYYGASMPTRCANRLAMARAAIAGS